MRARSRAQDSRAPVVITAVFGRDWRSRPITPAALFTLSIAVAPGVTGCAAQKQHNFSHINFDTPQCKAFKDPNAEFGLLKKFTLFHFAATPDGKDINAIEESQLLYVLKNALLAKGYECVDTLPEADFVVGLRYSNEYKETYIPPRQVSVPRYIPGGTSQTFSNFSGYAGRTYVWGQGTATTYHPGTWTSDTITVGGYNVGFFYPFAMVFIVDAKNFKQLWSGSTIASSKNADVRLTGQFLLTDLVGNEFPERADQPRPQKGWMGVGAVPLSRDGNSYFPTILAVQDKSPAKRAGLRKFDQVVAVNDRTTENVSIREFFDMFGAPGEALKLKVRRQEALKDITVVFGERPAGS
jgi:hypothetical protein